MARDKKKKVKRELSEEEKLAKAELVAFQAEELRKKKIRARRDELLKAVEEEQKISKLNMHKIHMKWRNIMRIASAKALHEDIAKMADKFDHEVKVKEATIQRLRSCLKGSDDQLEFATNNHAQTLSTLIDLHHTRVQIMEKDFQKHLKRLEDEFSKERTYITTTHGKQRQEMRSMMEAMEIDFKKALADQRQDFESTREELKNKSTEEYNVAKISLSTVVEDLEMSIQETHQTYLSSTEAKTVAFKKMVKKDTIMARLVEQRMRKLIRLHENLAYWRARIATNNREWEASNKELRDEKDRINKSYQELKRSLNTMHVSEHDKLKAISKTCGDVFLDLKTKLGTAKCLIKLGNLNKKLETEYEKIFSYHPFHCSLFPTIQEHAENLKTLSQTTLGVPHDVTTLEPTSSQYLETNKLSSYAIDDHGKEVDEIQYFDNFNKRFNKVMLEKMAINLERKRLMEENQQLQKRLEHYLDMSPTTKHKLKNLSLMV